jgi:UDP-2,3-diacylglucosamine pyrophosphatase LpxH
MQHKIEAETAIARGWYLSPSEPLAVPRRLADHRRSRILPIETTVIDMSSILNTEPPEYTHTLIISDVHLGSKVSRARELFHLLKSYRISKHKWRFSQLVLLGDIFDDLNFTRLRKHAWQVVGTLREITDEESNANVVWVLGNHDELLSQLMAHLVGVKVYEEYEWEVGGKKFLAMHGHQFDRWVINYPTLSKFPSWIYDMIQKFDGPKQRVSRYVKEKSKTWLRINEEVAAGIVAYASKKRHRIDAVFCGHTHIEEEIEFKEKSIRYYNTGCWTGKDSPTYITIAPSGEVTLQHQIETGTPARQSA